MIVMIVIGYVYDVSAIMIAGWIWLGLSVLSVGAIYMYNKRLANNTGS